MQVELLLSCGHLIIVPVESVILVPVIGEQIKCARCQRTVGVNQVGIPYRVEHAQIPANKNQGRILGDK